MYISLYSNFSRSFKGNQNYTLDKNEVIVRDDDTLYIYQNMNKKQLKEFKKDYAETVKGIFKITGRYPHYFVEYNN